MPTLVDHEKDRVVVDSLRICEHLIDSANSTKRLLGDTESERADILKQASIVDRTPQPALLYGFHPDDDRRPEFIKAKMADAYDLKIEAHFTARPKSARYRTRVPIPRISKLRASHAQTLISNERFEPPFAIS